MTIALPELAVVLLVGPSGSGKTPFAHRHFPPEEIIRPIPATTGADGSGGATVPDADSLAAAERRLAELRSVVVDAPNLLEGERLPWLQLARRQHVLPVAIAFDLPTEVWSARSAFPKKSPRLRAHQVRQEESQLRKSLRRLEAEGVRAAHTLRSVDEVENATVERIKLPSNRRDDSGPVDLIGDVHGCSVELRALLTALGYAPRGPFGYRHPQARRALLLGDLVDRGPATPEVVEIARVMSAEGDGLAVIGNHDLKFLRAARGEPYETNGHVERSLAQYGVWERDGHPGMLASGIRFLEGLGDHYVFDGGELVAAHAGLKEELQGRNGPEVRKFCLYGDVTGKKNAAGEWVCRDWASAYRGRARVVYGHTFAPEPRWVHGTIDVDTGCPFGGRLTALRYPELELVSVPSAKRYSAY